MDGLPSESYVSRHSVKLVDDGTPVVGRGRGIAPPKYTSTPMDEQGEATVERTPMVGRGRGLLLSGYVPNAEIPKVDEHESDDEHGENYDSDREEKDMNL
jgi:hypothetical protein